MGTTPAPSAPNRLLAASRLVHQLWRSQDRKVDINGLLEDEVFARSLVDSARIYADPKTSALIDEFEKASIESGAWRTKSGPAKPGYQVSPGGTVSAAAAWDPSYNPPISIEPAPDVAHVPTTSPRTSMTVKEQGSSGIMSRFGFSRPLEAGDTGQQRKGSLSGSEPASPRGPDHTSKLSGSSSLKSGADSLDDEPVGPIDPNHKKYVRGAR